MTTNFEQIRARAGYVLLVLPVNDLPAARSAETVSITPELRAGIASQWADHAVDMFDIAEWLGIERDEVRAEIIKFTEDELHFVHFNWRQAGAEKARTQIALRQYQDAGNSIVHPASTPSLQVGCNDIELSLDLALKILNLLEKQPRQDGDLEGWAGRKWQTIQTKYLWEFVAVPPFVMIDRYTIPYAECPDFVYYPKESGFKLVAARAKFLRKPIFEALGMQPSTKSLLSSRGASEILTLGDLVKTVRATAATEPVVSAEQPLPTAIGAPTDRRITSPSPEEVRRLLSSGSLDPKDYERIAEGVQMVRNKDVRSAHAAACAIARHDAAGEAAQTAMIDRLARKIREVHKKLEHLTKAAHGR